MSTNKKTSSAYGDIGNVLRDAHRVHGNKLWWLVLLMSVVALGEGLSMTLLLPLLDVIGIDGLANSGPVPTFVKGIVDFLGISGSVIGALLLILGAFTLQSTLYIFLVWWMASIQRAYSAYWQQQLFKVIMQAKWSFISRHKQGELSNAITQEIARLGTAFMVMSQGASHVIVIVVYLTFALLLSWQTSIGLVLFAVVLFTALRTLSRRSYRIGKKISKGNGELMVVLNEYLSGAKLIKATATEAQVIEELNVVSNELKTLNTWATFFPGFTKGVFEFCAIIVLCVILVIGHSYSEAILGQVFIILALFVRLMPRFNALQQNIQALNANSPALHTIQVLFDEATVCQEANQAKQKQMDTLSGHLGLNNMSAGFGDNCILQDLTMAFPEKGIVGIVGESGAGKSTLVHAILGLSDLQKGDICFGEASIKAQSMASWRHVIGYVPQETILFHRTVRENIAWGVEDPTDEDIFSAAKKAHAHDFIVAMPEGYDTVIGDQGSRLSGGQRQRLGIARALLSKPRYLLLDEATSALDSGSEAGVLETLEELRTQLCIISVAHRLSTVRGSDLLIVLDQGKIVESGDWQTLVEQQGILFMLAQKQHMV